MSYFSYKTVMPDIVSCEGAFVYEYRDSRVAPPLPLTAGYVFDVVDEEDNLVFYLDVYSKKKIYPYEFIENKTYKVYYEKDTKIIVGIEEQTNQGTVLNKDRGRFYVF